jgi:mRNA-degrading endonuclease toxin of MazEF toxin-antitoxin module
VAPLARVALGPSESTGLRERSFAMADKVTTVHLGKVDKRIGEVAADDMRQIDWTGIDLPRAGRHLTEEIRR